MDKYQALKWEGVNYYFIIIFLVTDWLSREILAK